MMMNIRWVGYCAQMLLGSVVDSWDKLRETATEALMALPAPLPGLEQPAQVAELLRWARTLVSSPRVRESDAGVSHTAIELCLQCQPNRLTERRTRHTCSLCHGLSTLG